MVDYYKEFGLKEDATEAEIRAAVGAPSIEEEDTCMCGELISDCEDAYTHMTHGV